jgi:hypothetical protein
MNAKDTLLFENMYDKYSPMVYGIVLEISPTKEQAGQILVRLFQKVYEQNILQEKKHCLCATLIKLTIQTAQEQLKQKKNNNFLLFKDSKFLNMIICEERPVTTICEEYKMTFNQVTQKIREELHIVQHLKKVTDLLNEHQIQNQVFKSVPCSEQPGLI